MVFEKQEKFSLSAGPGTGQQVCVFELNLTSKGETPSNSSVGTLRGCLGQLGLVPGFWVACWVRMDAQENIALLHCVPKIYSVRTV